MQTLSGCQPQAEYLATSVWNLHLNNSHEHPHPILQPFTSKPDVRLSHFPSTARFLCDDRWMQWWLVRCCNVLQLQPTLQIHFCILVGLLFDYPCDPPNNAPNSRKLKYEILNQQSFVSFYNAKPPCTNVKPRCWRLSGDGSACNMDMNLNQTRK